MKKNTSKKKAEFHTITVKQKPNSGKVMTGATTVLLLDGKPVKGATRFTFDVASRGLAKCTIELIGSFDIEAAVEKLNKKIQSINKERVK